MNRYLLDNPALERADWLPEGVSDDLDALREKHRRLVRVRADAADECGAIRRAFKGEDDERGEALKGAYAAGSDPGDVAEPSSAEERRAKLARAEERVKAANAALAEFVAEAIGEIKEKAPAWFNDLNGRAADAETKRQEAARLLAEAEAEEERMTVLRMWLERTALDRPGWHIPFAILADQRAGAPDLLEISNRGVTPRDSRHPTNQLTEEVT